LEFRSVGFWERGRPEYPQKNLSEQRREPTTNSTHMSPGIEPHIISLKLRCPPV